MEWRLHIWWKEALVFLLTQAIGLWVAWLIIPELLEATPITIPVWIFAIYLFFLVLLFFLATRIFRGPVFFQLFFALLIFIGSNIVFQTLGFGENAALLAVTIVVLRLIHPTVWTQNLGIVLALAGIGAAFGAGVSITAVILLLIVLCIYDVFAVYQTNYLVKVFSGLVSRGVFLSIIVPERLEDWSRRIDELQYGPGSGVVILGTGDIVLPLIFSAAALNISPWLALGSTVGAVLGLLGVHVWLLALKQQRALPALPPIALGLFMGYAITWAALIGLGIL